MVEEKKETKWGFLFAGLRENDGAFVFDPADYGLERGGKTANQARGVLGQNKATTMHRWSVLVEGTKIAVRRGPLRPIGNNGSAATGREAKSTPVNPPAAKRVSSDQLVQELLAMRERLAAQCAAAEEAYRLAKARVEAVDETIALV